MNKYEITGNGISKLRELLSKLNDDTQYGPEKPLNDAAQAEQKRHIAAIDDLMPRLTAAERALRGVREEVEDEQSLWSRNMKRAMPELGDISFQVSDGGKKYREELKGDEENSGAKQPPSWVESLVRDIELGKVTPSASD